MAYDDPKPDGNDPGTVATEGDSGETEGLVTQPEPEGDDPGRIETFGIEKGDEKRLDLSE